MRICCHARFERFGPWIALVAWIAVGVAPCGASAAEDPTQPSTSAAARAEAIQAIPYDKLDAAARAKVDRVLSRTSIYRRLPVEVIEGDPNLFLFLVRHPEVIVDIWRLMGVTEMTLERTSEVTFNASDGVGTTGRVEFLYGDHQTHLIYTEGSYDGALTPRPISARCLLVLQTGYIKRPDGRYYLTNRMDAFIDVENAGVELLAKTFQNLFGKTADHNFGETAYFLGKLSRTAESNREGIHRMAGRLTELDPKIRADFLKHADEVARRAAERETVREVARGQNPGAR